MVPAHTIKKIDLLQLNVSLDNPRYEKTTSQRDAMQKIIEEQDDKLIKLAEDIAQEGTNPAELLVTIKEKNGNYRVLEGNRRVTALKILTNDALLMSLNLKSTHVARIKVAAKSRTIPNSLLSVIFKEEHLARKWIQLRHTGENGGVGIVNWTGLQAGRFRGEGIALQALNAVVSSGKIDQGTLEKIKDMAITNVERVINSPEARKEFGVDVKKGRLIIAPGDEKALSNLAHLVSDVVNEKINVTHIRTLDERISYAKDVVARPAFKLLIPATFKNPAAATTTKTRRVALVRRTLIPKSLKLKISVPRINKAYNELQRLSADDFPNCAAVMLRVFLELSVENYMRQNNIALQRFETPKPPETKLIPKRLSLHEKLLAVIADVEDKKLCNRGELQEIRNLAGNKNHVLSIDALHGYIHNRVFMPIAGDLMTIWDNISFFMQIIWK